MSKPKFKNLSEKESPKNSSCNPHIFFYSQDFKSTNTMSAFAVSLGYLMLTLVGYLAMNNRYIKPSKLFSIKMIYNMIQIVISFYIAFEGIGVAQSIGYGILSCNNSISVDERGFSLFVLFYRVKAFDFMDTFIILSGGENNSFLSYMYIIIVVLF